MRTAFVEVNGASLTFGVNDMTVTGESAKEQIEKIIENMGIDAQDVLLYYCSRLPRITVRVKGQSAKIQDFENAITGTNKFCVLSNKGLNLP